MTENQLFIDKATALFFSLQNRYGFGEIYTSVKVDKFLHKFTFSNLRIGECEFSIGILHQNALTTMIFCRDTNAFLKPHTEHSIAYTLYAGRLGPKNQRHFYPSSMKLMHNRDKKAMIPGLMVSEILPYLGQTAKEAILLKDFHKEASLEIVFDKEARIKEVKKGL